MELDEFLRQTQTDVRASVQDRVGEGGGYPYPESVFAEVVMEHMSEIGMTFEPAVCHYTAKVGNATLRLSGYAVSDEQDQLDLFVSLYAEVDEIRPIPDSETKKAAEQCLRFLAKSADGTLAGKNGGIGRRIQPHAHHSAAATTSSTRSGSMSSPIAEGQGQELQGQGNTAERP